MIKSLNNQHKAKFSLYLMRYKKLKMIKISMRQRACENGLVLLLLIILVNLHFYFDVCNRMTYVFLYTL